MGTTYRLCSSDSDEVDGLIAAFITSTRPDLAEAGLTVRALFAYADEEPALKHNGYKALAVIKANNLKQRAEGLCDCTLTIDAAFWDDASDEQKAALIDHELVHPVLLRDKEGRLKLDDAGRPKIKMRLHDAQLGIFYEVVERHGKAAIEAEQYLDVCKEMSQRKFPWG
jgi:hypothetical protein